MRIKEIPVQVPRTIRTCKERFCSNECDFINSAYNGNAFCRLGTDYSPKELVELKKYIPFGLYKRTEYCINKTKDLKWKKEPKK